MAKAEDPAEGGKDGRRKRETEPSAAKTDPSAAAGPASGRKSDSAKDAATSRPAEAERPRSGPRLDYARPEPTLGTLRVLGLTVRPPMPPPVAETRAEVAAPVVAIPVYAPVDRAVPPDVFTHDITVRDPVTNQVNFVVRRPFNYPAGSFPAEPGRVPRYVDARTAVCYSLSRGAAHRCLRGGGYF